LSRSAAWRSKPREIGSSEMDIQASAISIAEV
jgi:hypothetical protein